MNTNNYINIHSDELTSDLIPNLFGQALNYQIIPMSDFNDKGMVYQNSTLSYKSDEVLMCLNWKKQISYHKSQNYKVKKQLLARALGIKGVDYHVFDLTCGTGKDTLLLLSFGAKVTAFERNPYVYTLLIHEYLKQDDDLKAKLDIQFGPLDEEYISKLDLLPNALYFDPMFTDTNRKKSALKRKEMVLFDTLVGHDEDASQFLEKIIKFNTKRVVVKRHPKSIELLKGITDKFEGKNARYDLYC